MRTCEYKYCSNAIPAHRTKYCSLACNKKHIAFYSYSDECIWCKKAISIALNSFCCIIHRRHYERFKARLEVGMFELKHKPKVKDSPKYKRMRDILSSITAKPKLIMSKL